MDTTLVNLARQLPYSSPSDVAVFFLKFGHAEPTLEAVEFSEAAGRLWPTISEGLRHIQLPWSSSYAETRRALVRCKRAGIAVTTLAARIELEGFFLARGLFAESNTREAEILENWISQVQASRRQLDSQDLDQALKASIGVTADEAISLLETKCKILRNGSEDFLNDLNKGFDTWASVSPTIHGLLARANSGESPRMLRKIVAANKYNRIRTRTLCENIALRFFLYFRDANIADSLFALITGLLDADGLKSVQDKMQT